jgi:hypothetical protein
MSTHRSKINGKTWRRRGLIVMGITALALAASPAALAAERGGPGAPSVQESSLTGVYLPVIRTSPLRLVSWSD